MFVKDYEFRYGDLDKNGNIRISTVLDVLQDAATRHSAEVGYDSRKLSEIKIAWLLEGWRVRIISSLDADCSATVKTGIMNLKSCESQRCYEVWQNGELKIIATADWFTVNTEKMRITRIPKECIDAFDKVDEPDNELHFERFKPETEIDVIDTRVVENRDLDTNNHLNNVKSAEIIMDYLPDSFCPTEFTIRYRKELKKGEKIEVCHKITDNALCYEIKNSDGDACVMMRFNNEDA